MAVLALSLTALIASITPWIYRLHIVSESNSSPSASTECVLTDHWLELPSPELRMRLPNGRFKNGISSVTYAWPSEKDIYVGGSRLYRSNDCGTHWLTWDFPSLSGDPLTGWYGNCSSLSSGLGVLFAAGGSLGLLWSSDSGGSWSIGSPADQTIRTRYGQVFASAISASPNSRYDVYAVLVLVDQQGMSGLGYSIDGGETWNVMSKREVDAPILQDALLPSLIYGIRSGNEIWISRWYGTTFEKLDASFEPALSESETITALAMSPDHLIFAAGTSGGRIYVQGKDRMWSLASAHPEGSSIVSMSLGMSGLLAVDSDGRLWHTRLRIP